MCICLCIIDIQIYIHTHVLLAVAVNPQTANPDVVAVRPISLLTLSLLTLLESNFPGKSLGIPDGPGNSTPLNQDCALESNPLKSSVSRGIGRIQPNAVAVNPQTANPDVGGFGSSRF